MKKIIYTFLFISIFLSSCVFENYKAEKPENLISKDDMAVFLADAYIAEAIIDMERIHSDSVDQISMDYYNYLFTKHGYDKETFLTSFNYYLSQPKEIEIIYEKVNEIINLSKEN